MGALAATLVVGILLGKAGPDAALPSIAGEDGRLSTRGELAAALHRQAGGEASGGARIALGFASRDGAYCRGFVLGQSAGLACREGEEWRIAGAPRDPATEDAARAGGRRPATVTKR